MMDKEKIQEGKIEFFPLKEDKEPTHPFNQQQSLKRQGFEKGVEWALSQVENYGVLDDVKAGALDCLRHILDPITHINKQAEEKGLKVNELVVFYLSRDIDYITGIASKFMEKHEL